MKISKTNRYLLAAGLCLLATLSCTKLQTNVYSVIPATSYWQTPAEVAAGVAPAYSTINGVSAIGGDIANMIEGVTDEMVVPFPNVCPLTCLSGESDLPACLAAHADKPAAASQL